MAKDDLPPGISKNKFGQFGISKGPTAEDTLRDNPDADKVSPNLSDLVGMQGVEPPPSKDPQGEYLHSPPLPGGIVRIEEPQMELMQSEPLLRPEVLHGTTYKLRWPESDHAFYITINDIEHNGKLQPFEMFINSKNMEHYVWTVGLTRMISAVFRYGGDTAFVHEELKAVFDPRGGQWLGGKYIPSLLAAIGEILEQHMKRNKE